MPKSVARIIEQSEGFALARQSVMTEWEKIIIAKTLVNMLAGNSSEESLEQNPFDFTPSLKIMVAQQLKIMEMTSIDADNVQSQLKILVIYYHSEVIKTKSEFSARNAAQKCRNIILLDRYASNSIISNWAADYLAQHTVMSDQMKLYYFKLIREPDLLSSFYIAKIYAHSKVNQAYHIMKDLILKGYISLGCLKLMHEILMRIQCETPKQELKNEHLRYRCLKLIAYQWLDFLQQFNTRPDPSEEQRLVIYDEAINESFSLANFVIPIFNFFDAILGLTAKHSKEDYFLAWNLMQEILKLSATQELVECKLLGSHLALYGVENNFVDPELRPEFLAKSRQLWDEFAAEPENFTKHQQIVLKMLMLYISGTTTVIDTELAYKILENLMQAKCSEAFAVMGEWLVSQNYPPHPKINALSISERYSLAKDYIEQALQYAEDQSQLFYIKTCELQAKIIVAAARAERLLEARTKIFDAEPKTESVNQVRTEQTEDFDMLIDQQKFKQSEQDSEDESKTAGNFFTARAEKDRPQEITILSVKLKQADTDNLSVKPADIVERTSLQSHWEQAGIFVKRRKKLA